MDQAALLLSSNKFHFLFPSPSLRAKRSKEKALERWKWLVSHSSAGKAGSLLSVYRIIITRQQAFLFNKWCLWADLHLRTKEDFFTKFSQGIVRLGLTYYLTDDAKLTAGYAYVNHFPSDDHKNIPQPEHRPGSKYNGIPATLN